MGHLTYDVAASLDGYIAGPGSDVSAFPYTGEHVDAYLERLQVYNTVIMGRKTYEFGYDHGLARGQPAYPGMSHVIFSSAINLPDDSPIRVVRNKGKWLETVDQLKSPTTANIYLCGGGQLAGFLLANKRIDRLCIKLAPIVLGSGTSIFGGEVMSGALSLVSAVQHSSGVCTVTYDVT